VGSIDSAGGATVTGHPILRMALGARVAFLPRDHRVALKERLSLLAHVLGKDRAALKRSSLSSTLASLKNARRSEIWLAMAVIGCRFPDERELLAASRSAQLDGPAQVLHAALSLLDTVTRPRKVRIAEGETLVDIHDTAHTDFFTGIQRVARECSRRWRAVHGVTLTAWTDDYSCLRDLSGTEIDRITVDHSAQTATPHGTEEAVTIVVPWKARYIIAELAAERPRTMRQLAMAKYTETTTFVIGYDTVPLTSSETSAAGMSSVFASYLAAARHYRGIAAISEAAAHEYRGWRQMLQGMGIAGPEIRAVLLAAESLEPSADSLEAASARFLVGDLPMILCVGSHEPRKNHMAVLQAADSLWQLGHRFSLTFIGGNGWNSAGFQARLAALQTQGRPVESVRGIDDDTLWAAYRTARFTVFPSLSEGFGLPVAESLASGTPVITSNYGSTKEIAGESRGALLVDPRNDAEIEDAIHLLLTDDVTYERLRRETRNYRIKTWQEYADELWAWFGH